MELSLRAPLDGPNSRGEAIERIASAYTARGPRVSLTAVEDLRAALPSRPAMLAVAVVGTNGKSSVATYLARLLSAAGARTGLYVSPHLVDWAERVRVDGIAHDPLPALAAVHRLVEPGRREAGDLRFFDLLTLAAERIFAAEGSEVAVFEAGIGGRLDAVRALEPRLVVLSSVAVDHAEILGDRPTDVLEEKLLAAPAGATVLSFPLGRELNEVAERVARDAGFQIAWADRDRIGAVQPGAELPRYLRAALVLAAQCIPLVSARLGRDLAAADSASLEGLLGRVDLSMPGRFERGEHDGVPYVFDIAHNEAAWLELARELRRQPLGAGAGAPLTALFSVSPKKDRAGLVEALRSVPNLRSVLVTRHLARPAEDPAKVAEELRRGGLEAEAVEDVAAATSRAFASAGRRRGGVLAFGSAYLIAAVMDVLRVTPG